MEAATGGRVPQLRGRPPAKFLEEHSGRESIDFARDKLGLDLTKGLTKHKRSRSSFAHCATEQLPDDWLVYFMDLCRDRVIWFAGRHYRWNTMKCHSLVGLMLPMSEAVVAADREERSRQWDSDGVIVQWTVSSSAPTFDCFSWQDFVQLRAAS